MNEKIRIDGEELESVPLHRAAVELLIAHGALPNGGRSEWIDGSFVPMTPANAPHASAIPRLSAAIIAALGQSRQILADAAFFVAEDTMLAPDLLVLPLALDLFDAVGADADLVIEVSQATLSIDLHLKAGRYAQAGVPDYWVVDLDHRLLHVHRGPSDDGFADVTAHPWETPVTALRLPALTLTLSEVLA
ncbi:MAG: Uma2 family endonuclease [Pseudomonadota bacterium]